MGKSIKTESRLVGAMGWGEGGWDQECLFNFFLQISFYGPAYILVAMVAQLCEYTERHFMLQNNLNEFHVTEFHLKFLKNDMRY